MQAPRGTRDFGPKEMAIRRLAERRLRDVLRSFNYREVQTPTFEELELFTAKSGEGILGEIYDFTDKGGRRLCLRPELTAPVLRFYFSDLKAEPKPLRLFYFGPCYRYDRPQAGRYREFWQLGAEVLGDASPEAHAEILWLALRLFSTLGLENIVLRVGHLGILRGLLEQQGVPRAEQGPLMRLIDKKDLKQLEKEMEARVGAAKTQEFLTFFDVQDLDELKARPLPPQASAAASHLSLVLGRLKDFGATSASVRLDPTISRGLDYYTGLVFELDCPALGAEKQLLGGGEYDLAPVFGAQPVAAVGFGLGFDRTLIALDATGVPLQAEDRVEDWVGALSTGAIPTAQRLAEQLRAKGRRVELDLAAEPPKKVLARAARAGARFCYLIGDRELEKGTVAVKDLDAGVQSETPLAQFTVPA